MGLSLRKACLPLILLGVPAASLGQANDAAVNRFNECAAVQDNTERLACFDRVTRDVRASSQPTGPAVTTPGLQAGSQQSLARKQREDFGLDVKQVRERRAEPQQIGRMTMRVAATRMFGAGYWALMMDDGAIWEVTELNAGFLPPKRGESVRIRRGVMGGYLLNVGSQVSVRVRRIS